MATRKDFIDLVAPIALKLRLEGSPIFPSVRIAQAILETGGKINAWNNLVGYKVGNGVQTPYWRGDRVSVSTWEFINEENVTVPGDFRVYNSIEDGFRDQDLLFQAARYSAVRSASTPQTQTAALQKSGYATDPAYTSKLNSIIATEGLTFFDEEVIRMLENLQAQISELTSRVRSLEEQAALTVVPTWAKSAVDAAVKAGLIDTPEKGSYDFYRLLTVLHRKGFI
ncbi:glycoside hydrolase family 73 protein [Paenibacillus qinlingensis]|uniref:glycoside hydrolase family 73 protein n=1 Tax=Paenibacillus qinlingensis TaxID=1837343 RepID=UPI001566B0EF|nr:glucosaminidase domain-containing protein [Paenibacillus qinlingensis]NQX62552.1 glucosaminidase domain-containing protein [Paenibacillus qinlingensis]